MLLCWAYHCLYFAAVHFFSPLSVKFRYHFDTHTQDEASLHCFHNTYQGLIIYELLSQVSVSVAWDVSRGYLENLILLFVVAVGVCFLLHLMLFFNL